MKVEINASNLANTKKHMECAWVCMTKDWQDETFTLRRVKIRVQRTEDGWRTSEVP